MFATAFKSFVTKPILANAAMKSALFSAKTPFQAALLQRGFARHFQKAPNQHTVNTSNVNVNEPQPILAEEPVISGPTVDKLIKEDLNLNKFMSKIYKTTGLSIAGSLGLSYLLATSSVAIAASPFVTLFGGLALSIGGIVALGRIPPEIIMEKNANGAMVEKWTNPPSRQLAFSSIIAGSGIMLSPFIQGLLAVNPGIIPVAVGLSVMTMGGASLYAMYKPLGQFRAWESTLTGALFGLIGMNITSLILTAMIGPNVFSFACGRVDMYAGLALFSMFQAFDTQVAVQAYKDGNYDHLMHVVNFFLNFKNIFIRIAQIMSMWRDD